MTFDPDPQPFEAASMFDLRPRICAFGDQRPTRTIPPPSIEVAPLVPGRVAAVACLDRMSFAVPWTEADYHKATAQLGRYGVIGLFGPHARVVSFCVCEIDEDKGVLTVTRFATDENMRKRGIMRRMFGRIADDAAFTGHGRIEVPCHETDADTRRFLQAIGFRAAGVIRGHYGDIDAYRMVRPVGPGACRGK